MEIRGVTNERLFVNQPKNPKVEQPEVQEAKDKIEISSEAKNLATAELGSQRLQEIREKINSKFYDSEDVLKKIADKIVNDLDK